MQIKFSFFILLEIIGVLKITFARRGPLDSEVWPSLYQITNLQFFHAQVYV